MLLLSGLLNKDGTVHPWRALCSIPRHLNCFFPCNSSMAGPAGGKELSEDLMEKFPH